MVRDFLDAENRGNRPTHVASNIAGRKALECSLIRRIRDGETINIWRDRWIPGAIGAGKPICPLLGALAMWVCEPLAADGVSWNSQA